MVKELSDVEKGVISTEPSENERQKAVEVLIEQERGDGKGAEREKNNPIEEREKIKNALQISEEAVLSQLSKNKDLKGAFIKNTSEKLDLPPEIVKEATDQEKGNLAGIQSARGGVLEKFKGGIKVLLASSFGFPGAAEALPVADVVKEAVVPNAISKVSDNVSNPILEEAKRKMTPETKKDAMRIGMNFPGQEQKKEIKFVRVGANESESSSAVELTKRLEAEDSPKESQDQEVDEGDTVESGNDEDSGVRVSPDVQFVGGKTPEKKHKTQKELDEEMLYRLTEEEKNQSIPSDESPSMLDSVVDAVKGAGLQAATALGKKSESSRHMFKPPTEILDDQKGDTVEIPLYKKNIGKNGSLELQGTFTKGQNKGNLKLKGGGGGDVMFTWEK